jgi:hypothetical protein
MLPLERARNALDIKQALITAVRAIVLPLAAMILRMIQRSLRPYSTVGDGVQGLTVVDTGATTV